jgi:hypothetical protein
MIQTTCLSCNTLFKRSRPNQQFCSNACRQKNYRLKSEPTKKVDDLQVKELVDQALALCEKSDITPIQLAAHLFYRETKKELIKFPENVRGQILARLLEEAL